MRKQQTITQWTLGAKFDQVYPHHESISALWNLEWKPACQRATYPFHDGKLEDFEPIFTNLIQKGIHDGYSDAFANEFIPTAERLALKADTVAANRDRKAEAIELYLRACAVYRIARFPYIDGAIKRSAYEAQKKTYLKAAALFDLPIQDINIPHVAATAKDGDTIPIYLRVPVGASEYDQCPAIIVMCGLDGHRPDFTALLDELTVRRGWASVVVDIPGTADCTIDRQDPEGADRLSSSVLAWMKDHGTFGMRKIVCWGLSAGGYYGIRAAHTHADDLACAVGQGAGTHHFFSKSWLEKAKYHEYPWTLLPALTKKFGYQSEEDLLRDSQKDFSLLESGILDQASCRLLLVNGTHDGLMPIEDSSLLLEHGTPKEARFFSGLTHMGNPLALGVVYSWIESVIGIWSPKHN